MASQNPTEGFKPRVSKQSVGKLTGQKCVGQIREATMQGGVAICVKGEMDVERITEDLQMFCLIGKHVIQLTMVN